MAGVVTAVTAQLATLRPLPDEAITLLRWITDNPVEPEAVHQQARQLEQVLVEMEAEGGLG